MVRAREPHRRVPALRDLSSLLCLHGAGSGPGIFDGWNEAFPGAVETVDLHAGLNLAEAAMSNYEAAAVRAADGLARPLGLLGWSMGGLVALMAARRVAPDRLVLLEASPPGEVQGFDPAVGTEPGVFDPEGVYGPFPADVAARPESALARAERRRGISVPGIPCPALVVYGEDFPEERGRRLAAFYGAEQLPVRGASHWELVRDPAVVAAIAEHLG